MRQTLNRAFRLTLFYLCATTPWRHIELLQLKSDARRMQLVETCPHAWTLLSWCCTAVGLAGGMILLHACVTSSSTSPSASSILQIAHYSA